MRRFAALFGATTLAATATLSGFFLGTALGSAVFGARSRRWRRPLRAFGLLELGVGLGALLLFPLLELYRQAYPYLYPRLSAWPVGFAAMKLLLAILAVGIPTFCMGGTLPALGQAVAAAGGRLGVPVGGLYIANLMGAAAGTLAVPLALLPRLGLRGSYAAAVAGSLVVAGIACALGTLAPPVALSARMPADGERPGGPPVPRSALALAALSGLCTLALQASWTRMFALVHLNSQVAFAAVLCVFLAGLAGGGALARRALRRGAAPRRLLALAWLIAGMLVAVSPHLFYRLSDGLAPLAPGDAWSSVREILRLVVPITLPGTLALGTAVPLLLELASPGRGGLAGPAIGRILAVNTLGAIAGPVLATFALGPRLGLWGSLAALAGLLAFAAAWAGRTRAFGAAAAALLVAVVWTSRDEPPPVRVRTSAGERLVSVREGVYGTTAVLADDHDRWITVNNSYVLGGAAAADEERWQAHLPLLLHPSPRRVAFVGLGTGITAGAALHHAVGRVVALEIVPDVVEAARDDFADVNGGVVDDPRVTVVVDDGRNHLAAAPGDYDVIVGDLLVPWRPAEAPLYTRAHFESVRRSLRAEGVFCQWLPLYQLSAEQLASLVRTFVEVFPRTTLWRGNFLERAPTLALVGHTGTRTVDPAAVDARVQKLAGHEGNPFLAGPAGFWLFLVGPVRPALPWLARAPLNTDDQPWVELAGPLPPDGPDGAAVTLDGIQPFLADVAAAPVDGTSLAALDPPHQAWRATGAALGRASRTPGPEGQAQVLEILRTLPAELRRALEIEP